MSCRLVSVALFAAMNAHAALAETDWSLDPRYLGLIPTEAVQIASSDDGQTLFGISNDFECTTPNRLEAWDVSDPSQPRRRGALSFRGETEEFTALPNRRILFAIIRSCDEPRLDAVTFDVGDPDHPTEIGRTPLMPAPWNRLYATATDLWMLRGIPGEPTGRINIDREGRPHASETSGTVFSEPVRPPPPGPMPRILLEGQQQEFRQGWVIKHIGETKTAAVARVAPGWNGVPLGGRPIVAVVRFPSPAPRPILLINTAFQPLTASGLLDLRRHLTGIPAADASAILLDAGIEDLSIVVPADLRPAVAALLTEYLKWGFPREEVRTAILDRIAVLAPTPVRLLDAARITIEHMHQLRGFEEKKRASQRVQQLYADALRLGAMHDDALDAFVARNVAYDSEADICRYISWYRDHGRFAEITSEIGDDLNDFPEYNVVLAYARTDTHPAYGHIDSYRLDVPSGTYIGTGWRFAAFPDGWVSAIPFRDVLYLILQGSDDELFFPGWQETVISDLDSQDRCDPRTGDSAVKR